MLIFAQAKLVNTGIELNQLKTTGDAAYFSQAIAGFCQGKSNVLSESELNEAPEKLDEMFPLAPTNLPTFTGVFRGKDNYLFEIDGMVQKAKQWRVALKEKLVPGWGTNHQPVYRTHASSDKFGPVILLFYIPKGKRTVSYLLVVGKPLRSSEILHTFAFHHRIEEFWKLLKDTLELGDMHLRDREGAHACVAMKIISYLIVNMMKINLSKRKRFKNVTINKLVKLCPKFVEIPQIFKEHFHHIIPKNYTLDNALA